MRKVDDWRSKSLNDIVFFFLFCFYYYWYYFVVYSLFSVVYSLLLTEYFNLLINWLKVKAEIFFFFLCMRLRISLRTRLLNFLWYELGIFFFFWEIGMIYCSYCLKIDTYSTLFFFPFSERHLIFVEKGKGKYFIFYIIKFDLKFLKKFGLNITFFFSFFPKLNNYYVIYIKILTIKSVLGFLFKSG